MITDKNTTENDLLNYIRQSLPPRVPRRPSRFGITYNEYAEAENISRPVAERRLLELVRRGVLESRTMLDDVGNRMSEVKVFNAPQAWYEFENQ